MYKSGLSWTNVSIKYDEDGLEMLKVICPILNLLLLILEVLSNMTLGGIYKSL